MQKKYHPSDEMKKNSHQHHLSVVFQNTRRALETLVREPLLREHGGEDKAHKELTFV